MTGGNKAQGIIGSTEARTFHVERAANSKKYSAALSSELPVERWFGTEILSHAPEAINLERCERGLVLLFNHDMDQPLGRVQDVHVDGDKLRGTLMFGKRAQAQEIQQEIDDGMLTDISIRYSIDEIKEREDPKGKMTYLITRWTVLEASVVTVPADHTVGIGRSRHHEGGKHTKEITSMDDNNETAGSIPNVVTEIRGKRKLDEDRGAKNAIKVERERVSELQDIFGSVDQRFRGDEFEDLQVRCIRDGIKTDGARKLLLDMIQGTLPEQTPSTSRQADDMNGNTSADRSSFVQAGQSSGEKMAIGVQRSIELRAGLLGREEAAREAGSEFSGRRLTDMARAFANQQGLRVSGLNDYQMLAVVLKHSGQRDIGTGIDDFPGILANVSSKSLMKGWETAATTYRQWVRIGNLSDFKRANRTALSGMSILDTVPENAEYKYGEPVDRTEYITAVKYGKKFSISREALINDDLHAFTQVPLMMGRAADLTINKAVYDSLGSQSGTGPTLNQTSRALFNSTDANYTATSGGITVANIEVGRAAMARQLDPTNSMPLNIRPRYLLTPTALESGARVFVASEKDPVGATGAIGGATIPNPFFNQLTVVAEAYLDGLTNGTTAFYLIADQNLTDTYEVAFLNGQQAPYLESKNGWDIDGVDYKVRIEAGVAALDFRGMYRKKGA